MSTASGFHTFIAGLSVGDAYLPPGSPEHNALLVRTRGVAAIKASPVQISQLFEAARSEGVTLASLQTVYSAGSVVPLTLRRVIAAESSAQLVNLYGSTEAGRAAERVVADDELAYAGDVVSGTELQIVDQSDNPVAPGVAGIVRYRRPFQALGYLGDPETTQSTFRDGWFYTGDVGSLSAEGRLTLVGRSSSVINLGGVKVNPSEVEGFALTHPGIRSAAAFSHGERDDIPRFVLAVEADDSADLGKLATSLIAQFGPLAPQAIFRMPELPRNDMGKIQLAQIAETYANSVR
jgi:acyl-coenzyme A synthetase/AMP-(fatty) acid ligase